MRVGVIGIGLIGSFLCEALIAGKVPGAKLEAVAGRASAEERLKELSTVPGCRWTANPLDLAGCGLDLVVETAGAEAAKTFAIPILTGGSDLLLMSVGVLADPDFRAQVLAAATTASRKIVVPSGAIAGLDAVRAAAEDALYEITLTTTKRPSALEGSPYLRRHGVDITGLTVPQAVFEGSAREAIAGFPANVNVAIALGLAVGNIDRVRIRIVADPSTESTVHRVFARGAFGVMESTATNVPSPGNPRTSYLAALSALAAIRRAASPLQLG